MSPERSAAESSLRHLDTKVRAMCSDLHPDTITKLTAPSMQDKELQVIGGARNKFRNAVRSFLVEFACEITSEEKTQWEADMASTVKVVNVHKFAVLGKVSKLLLPPSTFDTNPMSEYERQMLDIQKRQLKLGPELAVPCQLWVTTLC